MTDTAITISRRTPMDSTRRRRLLLILLCGAQFLVVLDSTIVNVALPSIQRSLHFSQQNLQWVASGYALTFAGCLLLGGRSADLLGRRRIFFGGIVTFLTASFIGGLSNSSGMLIGARVVQGVGGAMMSPAALSLVNTNFEGPDRAKAIGIYGAMGGAGGAAGVLFGGFLTSGLGWRSVLFVNVPIGLALWMVASKIIANDRRTAKWREFDAIGAVLVTGALLLSVYSLTQAPIVGWATARTVLELVGAAVLVTAFVVNEAIVARPLLPLRTFTLPGVAVGNMVAVLVFSAMIPLFFFLTLYMQEVLGYSALQAGVAFLPLTLGVIAVTKNASRVIARFGPKPTLIAGPLVFSAGLLLLSRIPPNGHYATDILPGLLLASVGAGSSLVSVIISATRRVPPQYAGVAAGLVNTMQRVGTAVGLAVLTDIAAARTAALFAAHRTRTAALTGGFGRALLVGAGFALAAALVAAVSARRKKSGAPPASILSVNNTNAEGGGASPGDAPLRRTRPRDLRLHRTGLKPKGKEDMNTLKLNIIMGTVRSSRAADPVVRWVASRAEKHGGFVAEVLDLRDWSLPLFAEGPETIGNFADPTYSDPVVKEWNAKQKEADAVVFVTAEYNHSIPGVLKNALDSVFASFAFRNKPAAFVGYSAGVAGGVRAVEHLAQVAVEAEMVPLRNAVLIPQVQDAFDDGGNPTNPMADLALGVTLEDLAWWGSLLADARRNGQVPPAQFRLAAAAGHSRWSR